MRTLVARAEIVSTDCILEVGALEPEQLTELLAQRAGRVVAVEIDRDLLIILRERFAGVNNVTFVEGDVLAAKHSLSAEVIAALARRSEHVGVTKLVANLPYQVATPLVMNLLLDHPVVTQLCFTVQAEVGERITADPGSKAFGPLSILARFCAARRRSLGLGRRCSGLVRRSIPSCCVSTSAIARLRGGGASSFRRFRARGFRVSAKDASFSYAASSARMGSTVSKTRLI